MNFKYRPDDNETKLIVLYSVKHLRQSPSYRVLSQIVTGSADINYFELQPFVEELVAMGSLKEQDIDGETSYSLTDSGEEMCEYFGTRIPASIRQKIEEGTLIINSDRSDENKIYADYMPINDTEYKVNCGILENNVRILDFEMYAGSKERAKKMCRYFKEHTSEFYTDLTVLMEKNLADMDE